MPDFLYDFVYEKGRIVNMGVANFLIFKDSRISEF